MVILITDFNCELNQMVFCQKKSYALTLEQSDFSNPGPYTARVQLFWT